MINGSPSSRQAAVPAFSQRPQQEPAPSTRQREQAALPATTAVQAATHASGARAIRTTLVGAIGARGARPASPPATPATEDANRTINDLPEPLLRNVIDHLPEPNGQRTREQQLSSLQRVNRAFRQATQDSFRGEPHAGARRERMAVAARDILHRPDLEGTERSCMLATLFGKSKDIGLNLAHAPDASRLTILLDALSAENGLRTLHINASNMGPHFQTAIAQLLLIIASNPGMTECSIDVRDNDRSEEAAVLIRRQLEKSDLAGSVAS